MKRFKIFGFLFISFLILFVLVGCSEIYKQYKKSLDPVKLIWWMVGDKPKDYDTVMLEVNKYLVEKLGVELEIKSAPYNEYSEKMAKVISSDESYDIMWTSSWSNSFIKNVNENEFLDLRSILNDNGKYLISSIPDILWDSVTFKDNIYGVPVHKEIPNMLYFVFSKDYVTKYNFDYASVADIKSLEPFLNEIKQKEHNITPFELNATEGYLGLFDGFDIILENIPIGIDLSNKDSVRVINPFNEEKVKNKLNVLHKWYQSGIINVNAPYLPSPSKFRIVSVQNGYPGADSEWTNTFGYDVVSVPFKDFHTTISSTLGSVNAISSDSKNPEKAIAFLNLLNSDTYLSNLLSYGIEGVHYKKISDNNIEQINKNYYGFPHFVQASPFNTYKLEFSDPNKWEKVKQLNDSVNISPIIGFIPDTGPIKMEVSNCEKIYMKYKAFITTGAVDPEVSLYKMIDEMNKAGYNNILIEIQKQVNEFIKNKNH